MKKSSTAQPRESMKEKLEKRLGLSEGSIESFEKHKQMEGYDIIQFPEGETNKSNLIILKGKIFEELKKSKVDIGEDSVLLSGGDRILIKQEVSKVLLGITPSTDFFKENSKLTKSSSSGNSSQLTPLISQNQDDDKVESGCCSGLFNFRSK